MSYRRTAESVMLVSDEDDTYDKVCYVLIRFTILYMHDRKIYTSNCDKATGYSTLRLFGNWSRVDPAVDKHCTTSAYSPFGVACRFPSV